MSHIMAPFQLLEINIISAQDLSSVFKSTLRTFAVAWLNPDRKLTTRPDQTGQSNPTWNEKFVFRVENEFLNHETSTINFEIYSTALIRNVLIGSVSILLSDLLPPSLRTQNTKSKTRFVTLQIRRPSGRPQGILNVGVTLLDGTLRSMPLCSELSASGLGCYQTDQRASPLIVLKRSKSERTDTEGYPTKVITGSMCNGSVIIGSEVGVGRKGKNEKGIGKGSLVSDVGPSASVVAAAIARGFYPIPKTDDNGSSILEDWTEKDSAEGIKTIIERWRAELPPIYDHKYRKIHSPRRIGGRKEKKNGSGLFSCFGTAYGCEFSISCGGGKKIKKKNKKMKNKKRTRSQVHLNGQSELTYDDASYL